MAFVLEFMILLKKINFCFWWIFTEKGYLTFDGLIKVVGDAKLFGIACLPNTTVKHEDGRLFIKEFIISCKHFFMRWAPDSRSYDADKFYTLAGKVKYEYKDNVVQQI